MELSCSNIKKILIIPEMKPCAFRPLPQIFYEKPALKNSYVLIFPETEHCTFQ